MGWQSRKAKAEIIHVMKDRQINTHSFIEAVCPSIGSASVAQWFPEHKFPRGRCANASPRES